jgi:hypothetical protein
MTELWSEKADFSHLALKYDLDLKHSHMVVACDTPPYDG